MNEARSSDPVDPLQGYADLAVFYPTRYKVLPETSKPFDLEAVHTQLKAMALQHSPSTLDQAKNIVSGIVEIPKSGIPQALRQKDEVVPETAEENPRQRRPGLDRKRARFSMKPSSSQPAISLLPPLDIKKLKDPEEFFKAYERHDNAQREIKKQVGAAWDSDQHNPPPIKQSRRPQLFERTVKYKHLYPSLNHETSENLTSSQEMSKTSILSPLNHSSQTESNDAVALQEVDLAGSIAKEDNNLKEILDALLSKNTEDLEGDGAINLLQEHLKIKPIELEELCLPESQDIPKFDFNSSRRTLPKPTNVFTDIGNLMKRTSSRTPAKRRKGEDGSIHLASPTQPKSPFASLSALKKRILQSNLSGDPFSADGIDLFPAFNPSAENGNKQSDLFEMGEEMTVSDELKLPSTEQNDHIEVAKTGSPEVDIEEISHIFEIFGSDDASKLGADIDAGSSRYHVVMDSNTGGSNMDNRVMGYTLSIPHADTDTSEIGANNGDKVEDKLEEAVVTTEPELNVANSTLEKLKDQLHSAAGEEHATDGVSRSPDTGLETNNKIMQEDSGGSLNKQTKANSRPRRKQESKKVSKRQSLTAVEEHQMDGLFKNLDTSPETHNEMMQEDPGVSLNKQKKAKARPGRKQKSKEVSKRKSLAAIEEHQTDGLSRNLDAVPETHNEEMQGHSEVSLNKQIKENSRPHRKQKSKEFSKRHSLAGAGTMWQSGVRRSTRIKTRPLQYWKGERLLYGRVHDTMATVIGIKYASPGKGDGAPLKVKSFVSDEYKELVELAALH